MNIAVNCRLLQKDRLEGIGWFMYETLKRITNDHPEHEFFFIFDRPYDREFIFSDNVNPIVAGPPARHPFLWTYWMEWIIPSVLKRIKADLFFSPDGYLSLRSKVPSIPVIHDINFAHRPGDLPFWTRHFYNFFFPRYARKGQRVCTVSEYSKYDLNKMYGIALPLIHVVYNGANPEFRAFNDSEKMQVRERFSNGRPYFIFIGSIHPRKNLDNLLKAFALFVKKSGSGMKMVIVGSSMWNKDKVLRKMPPEGVKSQIIFTGRLEASDLAGVLSAATALTFVPWFEGFGIPVLEAMYAQIPILTSTETSLPEVAGEAALYAHPGNIEEIAEGMERLATDVKLREALIEKANQQKLKFSWDLTAKKTWNCLETVIRNIENTHGIKA